MQRPSGGSLPTTSSANGDNTARPLPSSVLRGVNRSERKALSCCPRLRVRGDEWRRNFKSIVNARVLLPLALGALGIWQASMAAVSLVLPNANMVALHAVAHRRTPISLILAGADHGNVDFPGARALALDLKINATQEKERCRRYGWAFDYNRNSRRRLFYGAAMTEEVSWWSIRAVAAEGYGIYHSVAYIEPNTTYDGHVRTPRFLYGSDALQRLQSGIFGPNTPVSVDPVHIPVESSDLSPSVRVHLHREAIVHKWRQNGMQPHDVGIVANTDETFTRDFLRAAQICEVPQFEPGQDCVKPKLLPFAMVFEGSADCIAKDITWWHPDMALGECIESIGDPTVHKPVKRVALGGHHGPFHVDSLEIQRRNANQSFPLWNGGDLRSLDGGTRISLGGDIDWAQISRSNKQPTGVTAFHFHNFFETLSALRQKYKKMSKVPLGTIDELRMMAECAENRMERIVAKVQYVPGGLESIIGPTPLLFTDHGLRTKRNEELYEIIEANARSGADTGFRKKPNEELYEISQANAQSIANTGAASSPFAADVDFFNGRSGCSLSHPRFMGCGYDGHVFTSTMYCNGRNQGLLALKVLAKPIINGTDADGPFRYSSMSTTSVKQAKTLYQRMLANSKEAIALRYFALPLGSVRIPRPMLYEMLKMAIANCWRSRYVKYLNSTGEGPIVGYVFHPLGQNMDEVLRTEVPPSTLRRIVKDVVYIYTHMYERHVLHCDVHLRHFVLSKGNKTAMIDFDTAALIDSQGEAEKLELQQNQLWQLLSVIGVMCTRNAKGFYEHVDLYVCHVNKRIVEPNVTQLMLSFKSCNFDRPMVWRPGTMNNTRQTLNDLAYWSGTHSDIMIP